MPEISPDNEIAGITRSLNEKQRMVFNLVHMRSRIFHQKFVKKKMFYHSSNSNISVRQWRYRKVSSNKNYLPGCFKTITLSCQRSIETLCSSVASNRHIQASRISRHLMDRAMKQSTHQFHKVCFHISKCLACNAEKFLQLKITKKE